MSGLNLVLLETAPDSMTVGWGLPGVPREVEIKVNDQATTSKATVSGGLVKKKNLKAGDSVAFRLRDPSSSTSWGPWVTFEHDGGEPRPPPPSVVLERASEDPTAAVALVEFPPISGCAKYEVQLFPLDGPVADWTKVSDALTSTAVRKKNLSALGRYSFRYRGFSGGNWGAWSAATIPQNAPEKNLALVRALAPKLMKVDGTLVDASTLSGKVVALYFSAHWCPPCRQFTPKLVEFYSMMKAMGKPFEVVFVSADHDERSFREYFGSMGWLAVPYDDPRREDIQAEHQVRGIPALKVISGNTGRLIEPDAIRYPLSPATVDGWFARI